MNSGLANENFKCHWQNLSNAFYDFLLPHHNLKSSLIG
jgi:hypothetical protein